MPRRVTYIVASVEKAVAFEWIADLLPRDRFELRFILLNPGDSLLEKALSERGIPCDRVLYSGYGDLPAALWRTLSILRRDRPHTVHTHLLPACLLGLAAARLAGVPQRVYTRHHSTFHHVYAPRWVTVDRLIDAQATHVVAISRNVQHVLEELERVPAHKVRLIHHGFRFRDFDEVTRERVHALRAKYGLESVGPVVGVISRYIAWKGVGYVVEAARTVLAAHPGAVFVFANARGDARIAEIVRGLPEANRREIPFEPDVFALYRLFDVHVHTPIDPRAEAFGQTYVEALAAGIPSVFTLSGVGSEFVRDEVNALVVPYRDAQAIARGVLRLLSEPELVNRIRAQGRRDVEAAFGVERMVRDLSSLYEGA